SLLLVSLAAVALNGPPAANHHRAVVFTRRPRHRSRHGFEGEPRSRAELRDVVYVPALLDHSEPVAFQDRFALRFRQLEFIQVRRLIGEKRLAVLILHERHAEIVEVITLRTGVLIEQVRARDIGILFGFAHGLLSDLLYASCSKNRAHRRGTRRRDPSVLYAGRTYRDPDPPPSDARGSFLL